MDKDKGKCVHIFVQWSLVFLAIIVFTQLSKNFRKVEAARDMLTLYFKGIFRKGKIHDHFNSKRCITHTRALL